MKLPFGYKYYIILQIIYLKYNNIINFLYSQVLQAVFE